MFISIPRIRAADWKRRLWQLPFSRKQHVSNVFSSLDSWAGKKATWPVPCNWTNLTVEEGRISWFFAMKPSWSNVWCFFPQSAERQTFFDVHCCTRWLPKQWKHSFYFFHVFSSLEWRQILEMRTFVILTAAAIWTNNTFRRSCLKAIWRVYAFILVWSVGRTIELVLLIRLLPTDVRGLWMSAWR